MARRVRLDEPRSVAGVALDLVEELPRAVKDSRDTNTVVARLVDDEKRLADDERARVLSSSASSRLC